MEANTERGEHLTSDGDCASASVVALQSSTWSNSTPTWTMCYVAESTSIQGNFKAAYNQFQTCRWKFNIRMTWPSHHNDRFSSKMCMCILIVARFSSLTSVWFVGRQEKWFWSESNVCFHAACHRVGSHPSPHLLTSITLLWSWSESSQDVPRAKVPTARPEGQRWLQL